MVVVHLNVCFCVFMYTDISQSREIVRQPSHLCLFSSEELGCVCLYLKSIAASSHLRLLCTNWLGSGLRRLVALMEVSFPQLFWSFSPQNNLLLFKVSSVLFIHQHQVKEVAHRELLVDIPHGGCQVISCQEQSDGN